MLGRARPRRVARGVAVATRAGAPTVQLLLFGARERARSLLVRAWPRGRVRVTVARDTDMLLEVLASTVPDAIVVDIAVGAAAALGWRAVELAVGADAGAVVPILPARLLDASLLIRARRARAAEVLIDGVDDGLVRTRLHPLLFSTRFAETVDGLLTPHELGPLTEAVWRTAVSHAGRLANVAALAGQIGVSREHLARRLAAAGSPGPKALLGLVRLLAAHSQVTAGVPASAIAPRLGYATPSHLSRSARELTGVTPRQWLRLSPPELLAAGLATAKA
jgi:AraC-like DNA-binding protein